MDEQGNQDAIDVEARSIEHAFGLSDANVDSIIAHGKKTSLVHTLGWGYVGRNKNEGVTAAGGASLAKAYEAGLKSVGVLTILMRTSC